MEKRILMATFIVKNLNDDLNPGSLRTAITGVNASTDATNIIDFNIAATGVQTIPIKTVLPTITKPVLIDGTSEQSYAGTPIVVLSGAGAGLGIDGLDIAGGNSTVQGLAFNSFSGEGISLSVAGGDTIQNNYIGVSPAGNVAAGNALDGVLIQTASNANKILNNVISANTANGIFINGGPAATAASVASGTIITGNKIGTDAGGVQSLGNGFAGIRIQNAPTTTIGGTTAAARNIISANQNGLVLGGDSDTSIVQGNYIGTNAVGGAALGAGATVGNGIVLSGIANLTIGGTTAGAGNLISGNTNGVIASGFGAISSNITIQGNFVGTNAAGRVALPNTGVGLALGGAANVTIGGTTAAARNIISGNSSDGIQTGFFTSALVVQGNYIGTDVSGALPLGNGGAGINLGSSEGTIGGLVAGAANIIANNGTVVTNAAAGVEVNGGFGGINDSILSNSIYNNQNLGIALLNGGNNNQLAPVLTSAVSQNQVGVSSTFTGTLSAPDGTYTVQFFYSFGVDPSGNAEGQNLIGTTTVPVVGGSSPFTVTIPTDFTPGAEITATATDVNGNTSQFSVPVLGTGSGRGTSPPTITETSSPATIAAGQNVTDTFTITNPSRVADLGVAFFDTVPAGTTFFSGSTSTGAFVVATNGVINAPLGTILPGQSVTVTIILTAGSGAVPSFTNIGGVTATTPTVNQGDVTASATTTVTPSGDLNVSVVGPAAPVPVGGTVVYQVTLSNFGPSDASGVSLVNTLPAGVTFVSATSTDGTTPTNANGVVTDTVGTITAGSTVTFTITALTNGGTPTSIIDSATVTATTPDSDPTNNTATAVTTIIPSADLAITSDTAAPTAVVAGSLVTFTIDVLNNGESPAAGTLITDTLPAGLIFVSGTAAGGAVTATNGVVTAPIGNLLSGGTSVVTIVVMTGPAGTLSDSAVVSSNYNDPNPSNNTGTASVAVTALNDVAVSLTGSASSINTGNPLIYTAVVTNSGPSPATNVVLTDPLFAGATFVSATASNGTTGTFANGVVTLNLGTIAAGTSVTVTLTVIPTTPGTVTNTVTVGAAEPDSNPGNNSASVTTTLTVPAPIIAFSATTYSAPETAGTATITLTRTGDTSGTISVLFSTVPGGNGTAGLDYVPVSQVVTFGPGVEEVAVTVPVLANPFDRVNEFVDLQLSSPVNAVLAGNAAVSLAVLEVINVDPLIVGPTVLDVKLIGPVSSITGIEVDTTGKLDPTTASNAANYAIVAYGSGKGSLPAGTVVPVSLAAYNPVTGAVLLIPSTPLPSNQLFLIDINGTRTGAVSDLAGNPLNSVYGVTAASDYLLTVARGNNLNYTDENGAQVNLKLTGPGTLDIDRTIAGQVGRLQVIGPVARKTTITGTVQSPARRTNIGVILGLGQFGSVATKLYTPPFYALNSAYPDPTNLNNAAAVDTLLPTPATTTTTTKKTTKHTTVKAKAVTTPTAQHPTAALAHAVHARTR